MKSVIYELRSNRALVLVLVAFTVLSATYSFVTRLKYGPDEPAHFIYVRSIARDFTPPPISHEVTNDETSTATHEGHQPPLYYALMAIPYAALNALGVSNDGIWRALRLLNILLGLVWICAVYTLAFEFLRDRKRALWVTAFVALIPTSAYTAGVINNENLISPLFTCSLVPMLACFRAGTISRRSALGLGVLIGLSILAKAQGLMLIVMLLIATITILRRQDYRNWKPVLASSAIAVGTAVLVSGWWFLRNWMLCGELMPQSLYKPVFPSGPIAAIVMPVEALKAAFFASCLTYGHFWAPYWLIDESLGGFLTYLYPLLAITAVVFVGLAIKIRRDGDVDRRSLAFLITGALIVYLSWLRHALFVDVGANMQGRLFLCVAAVVGIVWIMGVEGLGRSRKVKSIILGLLFAVLLAGNAVTIAGALALYSH